MSAEILLGKLSGADLLKALIRDSLSGEILRSPIRVKTWGRMGINAPYNIIVRQEVIADFLQNGIGLKPDQIQKTQVHFVGETPWKIPSDDRQNVFPPDDKKKRSYIHSDYAWFNVDEATGEHFLVVSAYSVWEELKTDRQHFIDWWRRKRKNDKSWEALGKRTKQLDASKERRDLLAKVTTQEELEIFLADLLSLVGKAFLIEHMIHEAVHSQCDRRSDHIRLSKSKLRTEKEKEEEETAERVAEELVASGKWNHMIELRVNPRRPRKKAARKSLFKNNY